MWGLGLAQRAFLNGTKVLGRFILLLLCLFLGSSPFLNGEAVIAGSTWPLRERGTQWKSPLAGFGAQIRVWRFCFVVAAPRMVVPELPE